MRTAGAPNRLRLEDLAAFERRLRRRTDEDVQTLASLALEELRRRGIQAVKA